MSTVRTVPTPLPPPGDADGRRRIGERNRQRLLDAATELFARRGYRGTTTRDIAVAAGITERTLFRHVPSKAALFREAVVAPVDEFVRAFTTDWNDRPTGSRGAEVEVREFYETLLAVIDRERSLLLALLAALADETHDADFPDLPLTFAPMLDALAAIFAVEAELRGWMLDHGVAVRLIVGMALSVTLHRDWLFAGGDVPSQATLVEQLTRFTLHGLAGTG